uniref:Osteoclast associated Ig-like receptor n=1 Tax=Microcebus murinus TaxID=30608 RepID=A0A8C5WA88_MICMU
MALVLILQLLSLWPLCHADITPSVPPASYSKPWLGVQPAAVVTPGVNVTLRCRAPQVAWRFALFKPGETGPLLFRDVSSELAEFFLEEVTLAQGGSYCCSYRRPDWKPGVWSQPSDELELLVTEQLPRPSLVALPGPVVARGANVSLRCAGRVRGMSFALYREGVAAPLQFRDSAQRWADFPLPGARAPGTYSCYYHTPSAPYVLSQRSEPLVISSEGERPGGPPQPLLPRTQGPPPSDPGGSPAPPPSDPGV